MALSVATTFFKIAPIKLNRLRNASVMNIEEESPNSIISFSYLSDTSWSDTLAMITNTDSENPSEFKRVSTEAKRSNFPELENPKKNHHLQSVSPPTKQKRFSIASIPRIVNITDELPNSMISCSYLFDTSSITTLAVMANDVWYSPSCLIITSMNAQKNAVVLLIINILCEFHQIFGVLPQLMASKKL
ncbi:hypothetical protein LWI29_007367 [Acer saccharum]|uniref:Uncharacterized protein n=1 Tax=Acer saccharum TaxID=4024 RepID=A0AA39T1K4_ACESA|nr:hypothetical protein LWI29_007367 [Acer saccharum]